ncbi:T9SS type A sorting domain-containing protein [Rufibacter immobilis]|uniref:T9SS type A sorting domain-containing protein n=1 Tax=Rufibacter immobilis TaxID=1348778 RepID=UPI0035E720D0
MKLNAVGAWLVAGITLVSGASTQAQHKTIALSKTPVATEAAIGNGTVPVRRETLSGIDLFPEKKNADIFLLSFQQDMTEDGVLEFTNASGKVLYTKPVPAGDHTLAPPVNIGKLKSGIYLVEVKTPTTVYWKKVRIRMR